MSNLVPERRVNKLGVAVVKHVRATQEANQSGKPIPAPSLRVPGVNKAEYYPKAYLGVSEGVSAIPYKGKSHPHMIVDDSVMYEMLSFINPRDALALIDRGIVDKDEALEVLASRNLSGLVVDHSEAVALAAKAKIPAQSLHSLALTFDLLDYEPQNIVDAAALGRTKAVKESGLDLMVLEGNAQVSDIKKITASKLATVLDKKLISRILLSLKNGSANYDAAEMKSLIEKFPQGLSRAVSLADQYGAQFPLNLYSLNGSWNIHMHLKRSGFDMRQEKAVLDYGDELARIDLVMPNDKGLNRVPYGPEDIPLLHASGVSAAAVAKELKDGFTVNQILARFQHGVPVSVSEGWL